MQPAPKKIIDFLETAMSPDQADLAGGYSRPPWQDIFVLSLIGLFEAFAFTFLIGAPKAGLAFPVLVHALSIGVLALTYYFIPANGRDLTLRWLGMIALLAAGPFGAIGAAVVCFALQKPNNTSPLLDEWYERIAHSVSIDAETRLFDNVSSGRTLDTVAAPPESFMATMRSGPLVDRQAILGLIARRFDPDYLPVLREALKSPEPVVRVQAAAVSAHIRPLLKSRIDDAIASAAEAAGDPVRALDVIQRIKELCASGLLDEVERARAIAAQSKLEDGVLSTLGRDLTKTTLRALVAVDATKARRTYEQLLLDRGHFVDLRRWRSASAAVRRHPVARVRRVTQIAEGRHSA